MRYDDFIQVIEDEGARFLEVLRSTDGGAKVPPCPEWTVRDLGIHLTRAHRWWTHVVEVGGTERPEDRPEVDDDPSDLAGYLEEGISALVGALRERDEFDPAWTWWGEHHVGRIARRMAHETAMHRWDIQAAAGETEPIDAGLATDGVREFIDVFLASEEEPWPHEPATIHLHRSDGRGNFSVTLDPMQGHSRRARDDAAVVSGTASDLLLVLWRRLDLDAVRVTGDRPTVERFLAWADLT